MRCENNIGTFEERGLETWFSAFTVIHSRLFSENIVYE